MDKAEFPRFLARIHPYNSFERDETERVAALFYPVDFASGETISSCPACTNISGVLILSKNC